MATRSSTASSAIRTRTTRPAAIEEFNYSGKVAIEMIPGTGSLDPRGGGRPGPADPRIQLGGLAGVWAEENTREAIFDAMQRKETFATSGPMIKVRFFGGWDFGRPTRAPRIRQDGLCAWRADGWRSEVCDQQAPRSWCMASMDPNSGNLDRIQVVKGWVDAKGKQREKMFDVV